MKPEYFMYIGWLLLVISFFFYDISINIGILIAMILLLVAQIYYSEKELNKIGTGFFK